MSDSSSFLKQYGDLSFTEMPFCDIDNALLCRIFYLPLEKTAPNTFDEEPVSFPEVYEKYFELCGNKHKAVGLVLPKAISELAMTMSKTKRYSEMKLIGAKETFTVEPAVQFGAVTFILPDGTNVIMFRGTDDSLIGWLEDLNIYTRKGIPSHQLAEDYLNEAADKLTGDIIVCGHSKGGNLAVFGALNCRKDVRDRIKLLYNNDGPGFHNFDYINTDAYRELLPRYRHFIPQSSLVGVLLAHDDDYTVVKSRWQTGPLEHDLGSWLVDGTEFRTVDKLTPIGKINDLGFAKLIFGMDEEQNKLLDKVVTDVVIGTGELYILGFVKNLVPAFKNGRNTWSAMDDDTKDSFRSIFAGTLDLFKETAKIVNEEALPVIKKRASNFVKGMVSFA